MTKQEVMKKAYVERDVSWMYFNHRILQEAEKEFVPLLERLSFLGIYSNNLDEFFRVRVASLNRMLERKLDKDTEQQIKKSLKTINKLNESYSKEYTEAVDKVFEELETHKIRLVTEANLNEAEGLPVAVLLRQTQWLCQSHLAVGNRRSHCAGRQPHLPHRREMREERQQEEIRHRQSARPHIRTMGENTFQRRLRQHHVSRRCDTLLSATGLLRVQREHLQSLQLQVHQRR